MKIVGCDLHARQQSIAIVDSKTGELVEKTLLHQGSRVRGFYAALEGPVVVGIEATGSMQWFPELNSGTFAFRPKRNVDCRARFSRFSPMLALITLAKAFASEDEGF